VPAEVFSVPTSKFIRHELFVWLPWFIKRYFFFQRHLEKPIPIIAVANDPRAPHRVTEGYDTKEAPTTDEAEKV
jgi:hypothetical protein